MSVEAVKHALAPGFELGRKDDLRVGGQHAVDLLEPAQQAVRQRHPGTVGPARVERGGGGQSHTPDDGGRGRHPQRVVQLQRVELLPGVPLQARAIGEQRLERRHAHHDTDERQQAARPVALQVGEREAEEISGAHEQSRVRWIAAEGPQGERRVPTTAGDIPLEWRSKPS